MPTEGMGEWLNPEIPAWEQCPYCKNTGTLSVPEYVSTREGKIWTCPDCGATLGTTSN